MDGPRLGTRILVILGILLYLPTFILYFGARLLTPDAAAPLFWGVWLAGVWLLGRWARQWSLKTLAVAPVSVAIWMGIVTIGERFFGWTA